MLPKGCPPFWSPPAGQIELRRDFETGSIVPHTPGQIYNPLEPLFRALDVEKPNFQLEHIDLVTDRNNVHKLLGFVQGSSDKSFQIRVEVVGGLTALFTSVETAPGSRAGSLGFGRNFEAAFTKKEHGDLSHHRIVGYSFGGMKCIIRHETDGYIASCPAPEVPASGLPGGMDSALQPDDLVSNPAATVVERGGRMVHATSTLEIKTRRADNYPLDIAKVFPQLWISQTPKLAVAYHRLGVFDSPQVRDMTTEVDDWESANQKYLRRLAFLLRRIVEVVKEGSGQRAVVVYEGGKTLKIVRGDGRRALPADLYRKWGVFVSVEESDVVEEGSQGSQVSVEDTDLYVVPDSYPFSDDITYALRYGLRQLFRRLPMAISSYRVLCGTLASLPVDVLEGRRLRDIMWEMQRGQTGWGPDRSVARDSAFRLVYFLLVEGVGDQNAAFNAVVFVASRPEIFHYSTRKVLKMVLTDVCSISAKQQKTLKKWPVRREEAEEEVYSDEERG